MDKLLMLDKAIQSDLNNPKMMRGIDALEYAEALRFLEELILEDKVFYDSLGVDGVCDICKRSARLHWGLTEFAPSQVPYACCGCCVSA